MPLSQLPYALVDVFAERPLEGNMLAIFTDARGLTSDQMQALARETNLAETTFILPADDPAAELTEGVRVRIFTTQEELDFAGHPTLGTASWLYWNHPTLRGAETISLNLNAGKIPVRFQPAQQGKPGVYGTMRQIDPIFTTVHDPAIIAPTLGLAVEDFDSRYPIQTVSTGMPFCIVPVRTMEALSRLEIPQAAAQAYLAQHGAKFFYCLTPLPQGSDADFHARMQFYNGEDPATGSASGCAISWLVQHGIVPSGQQVVIEQGIEIRRPSRLYVRATKEVTAYRDVTANEIYPKQQPGIFDVFVSGRTIPVASGHFFLT